MATLYYDGNGNLTDDGAWDFEYDAENRLTKASNATTGTTAQYLYDPMGRRQAKIVGSVTTSFLSDGAEEIAEYDGAGGLLRRYIPGPGTDQPIAMVTPSGGSHLHSYFHTNRQGSTVAMSNDAGTVAEGPYTYDAYGQGAPSTGVPFKYTGRRLDPETGLYYYRARYYSAALGRFLQTDPIGYADQMNLYGYVNNDPGNATDPSGEDTWSGGVSFSFVPGWGIRGSIEFSYDDETGDISVTGSVGARVGLEGGLGGKAGVVPGATPRSPEGGSGKITVSIEYGAGPVSNELEGASIDDKGDGKIGGQWKTKVSAKSVEIKAKGSAGADLKVSYTWHGPGKKSKSSSSSSSKPKPPKCEKSAKCQKP